MANRGFRGLGPCVEAVRPPRRLSYYNVTATLWGYSGQPLESLLGVIRVPRHPGGMPSPKPGLAWGERQRDPQAEGER